MKFESEDIDPNRCCLPIPRPDNLDEIFLECREKQRLKRSKILGVKPVISLEPVLKEELPWWYDFYCISAGPMYNYRLFPEDLKVNYDGMIYIHVVETLIKETTEYMATLFPVFTPPEAKKPIAYTTCHGCLDVQQIPLVFRVTVEIVDGSDNIYYGELRLQRDQNLLYLNLVGQNIIKGCDSGGPILYRLYKLESNVLIKVRKMTNAFFKKLEYLSKYDSEIQKFVEDQKRVKKMGLYQDCCQKPQANDESKSESTGEDKDTSGHEQSIADAKTSRISDRKVWSEMAVNIGQIDKTDKAMAKSKKHKAGDLKIKTYKSDISVPVGNLTATDEHSQITDSHKLPQVDSIGDRLSETTFKTDGSKFVANDDGETIMDIDRGDKCEQKVATVTNTEDKVEVSEEIDSKRLNESNLSGEIERESDVKWAAWTDGEDTVKDDDLNGTEGVVRSCDQGEVKANHLAYAAFIEDVKRDSEKGDRVCCRRCHHRYSCHGNVLRPGSSRRLFCLSMTEKQRLYKIYKQQG